MEGTLEVNQNMAAELEECTAEELEELEALAEQPEPCEEPKEEKTRAFIVRKCASYKAVFLHCGKPMQKKITSIEGVSVYDTEMKTIRVMIQGKEAVLKQVYDLCNRNDCEVVHLNEC